MASYRARFELADCCWGRRVDPLKRLWSEADLSSVNQLRSRLTLADGVSVDAFVKRNPDFKKVAALSIAAVMLSCAREAKVRGDWYRLLAQSIHDRGSYTPNKLAVITFNYDRSLEFYLSRSFEAFRNEDYDFVRSRIAIHHVCGGLSEHPQHCGGGFRERASLPVSDHLKVAAASRR